MINADAFNEVLCQLKDARARNALTGTVQERNYYEIPAATRDLVGTSLRKRLAEIAPEDIAGIRACIKALRLVYSC